MNTIKPKTKNNLWQNQRRHQSHLKDIFKVIFNRYLKNIAIILMVAFLGANCQKRANLPGNGVVPGTIRLGGFIDGLAAGESVTLVNNANGDIQNFADIAGLGHINFYFNNKVSTHDTYNITADPASFPAGKTCNVGNNIGTAGIVDITGIQVTCGTAPTYTVGGTVSIAPSLTTPLVLKNVINGVTTDYAVINGGALGYTFPVTLLAGDTYSVSVVSQPTGPAQTCSIGGVTAGTIAGNITTLAITCVTASFTVGGTVSGVATGETISLKLTYDTVPPTAPTVVTTAFPAPGTGLPYPFTFGAIPDLMSYTVTVSTPPVGKTCTVTNAGGTLAGSSINNVYVSCNGSGTSTVGGDATTGVTGLAKNATLMFNLATNTGINENLAVTNGTGTISVNMPYTFTNAVASGATYTVTITNPVSPAQVCTFATSGTNTEAGTIPAGNVNLSLVTCVTNTYTVSFSVTGLTAALTAIGAPGGTGITVSNNGVAYGLPTLITADGPTYTFTAQNDGSGYNVAVSGVPGGITCAVGAGTGTLSGASVTNVAVTCAAGTFYTLGVSVSGLSPSPATAVAGNTLDIQLNGGGEILSLNANTAGANFVTKFLTTDVYSINIIKTPTRATGNAIDQVCTITSGASGSFATASILASINCAPVEYTISGTVNGLMSFAGGAGLTMIGLQTNGNPTATLVSGGGSGVDPYTSISVADGTPVTLTMVGGSPCVFMNGLATYNTTISGANITTALPSDPQNVICPTSLNSFPPNTSITSTSRPTVAPTVWNSKDDYAVIGATPGVLYQVSLTAMTAGADFDLYVYSDSAYSVLLCSSITAGTANETCVTSTTGSSLYIKAKNTAALAGSGYTISVVRAAYSSVTPYALTSPPVGTPTVLNDGAQAFGYSYYIVPVTANSQYKVDLTGLVTDENEYVYTGGFGTLKCSSVNTGTLNESCTTYFLSTTETNLYIKLYNNSALTSSYTLTVTNLGTPPVVGPSSVAAPIVLPQALVGTPTQVLPLLNNSAVNGVYYSMPVAPNQAYSFALAGLNSNYDLQVYSTADFVTTLACSSAKLGTVKDDCVYLVPAAGVTNVYILVQNTAAAAGVYSLHIDALTLPVNYNFDTGTLEGWTITGGLWHETSTYSQTPSFALWYANPATGTFATGAWTYGGVESPYIQLGAASTLSFQYALDGECGALIVCSFDKLMVQISTDGGVTWTLLSDLPDSGTAAGVFTPQSIPLGAYANMAVKFRFYFDSGDGVSNSFYGGMVDSISVF